MASLLTRNQAAILRVSSIGMDFSKLLTGSIGEALNWGMGMFPVSPEKEDELVRRMAAQGVREEDIEEKFVRSGGHGGQNVNKVATCVMLLHGPTRLQVKCQSTRRQGMNRYLARLLLLAKIQTLHQEKAEARRALREKVRRQKMRRSRAAQEKILAGKRRQSEKKSKRKRVIPED